MLKRLASLILVTVMIMSMGMTALAAESQSDEVKLTSINQVGSENNLYLSTDIVPEEVINYAVNNVFGYLVARLDIDTLDISKVYMGNPFTMAKEKDTDDDIYYFPIFCDNRVIYTFRVYLSENREYVGILSPYLAEEIDSFKYRTSEENPLSIYIDNGNVIALQNGYVEILEEDHLNREPLGIMMSKTFQINRIVNVSKPIEFVITPTVQASASHNLTLDMKEQQGSKPWCAAYAAASILRYKGAGSSVTAEAMMKATFPNSKDLDKESISRSQIVTYAKNKGYKNTTESSSTLTNTTVVSEIYTNSTPIYAGCAGKGDYAKARHALVICGYDNTKSTYTVWNPWYKYTETMSQSTKTYIVNSSSSFVWDCTIYKFRK
ncbi:C47 family peptidase [Tissierella sp.]|uniref:C47 family peptidase n=1 Tax=Tissierella sp. TaxID=41274 RepID=UPI0028B1501C|nr:C47 family peptidase [Tissierella sp.]